MPSSTEQVGQELIGPVFKCPPSMQGKDGKEEASNEMVCVTTFWKVTDFVMMFIEGCVKKINLSNAS